MSLNNVDGMGSVLTGNILTGSIGVVAQEPLANAIIVNGSSANGSSANGSSANGSSANGSSANGISTNVESINCNAKKIRRTIKKVKRDAVVDDDFVIPKYHEYQKLKSCNYKVKYLKDICRHYKQKVSGNKHELVVRIYNHLWLSSNIVKIQMLWKKHLLKIYNDMRGPARFNRKLSVNDTDFFTMEDIATVPYSHLYTYKDDTGQIYAFEIASLFNLFLKGTSQTTNPYNRAHFPSHVRDDLKRILRICKIFGDDIDVSIEDTEIIPVAKQLELRAIGLFHDIDSLGNYTDSGWFNNLDRNLLIRFVRELGDIWHYRAQLSHQVKREICPPAGNPFGVLNMRALPVYPFEQLKRIALNIIEVMIKHGITESNRTLGANYVLCALTLVSAEAATSMPWLFQSVAPQE